MDQVAGIMKEFGMGQSKGKGKSKGGGMMNSTAGKYIFTAIIVPWIFSRVIKPLRSYARIFLARHMKRGMRESGKKSMRVAVCGTLLKNLDVVMRKETLFAFWFALLIFLKSAMPHFKVAMRTLLKRMR